MSKKRNEKKNIITVKEANLNAGIAFLNRHPLFSQLHGYKEIRTGKQLGRNCAAIVNSNGYILLNKDVLLTPAQWAYAIAHCQLHLAFGHFDAEKMPGYLEEKKDGSQIKKVHCNTRLWNIACDMYIAKFLADIKFGIPVYDAPQITNFSGNLTDELKIYDYLTEHGELPSYYGIAEPHTMDMIGLEEPLTYNNSYHNHNRFATQFAYALAHSVSNVVSNAGGHGSTSEHASTPATKAAQWFINHYPLLGSLASAFKIIEDYRYCNQYDIQIAAIDVTVGEIYVNPAAGLSESELRFVLAHEYLHAGLQHHERCQGRDHYLWNVACDYVINNWLHDMQIGVMPENGLLYDEKLKDMSAESIYDMIVTDLRKYSKLNTFRGYGKGDILDAPLRNRKNAGKNLSGENDHFHKDVTSLDDFYRHALMQGLEYHVSNGRGTIPSGLIEEIRALAMPPIPWDVKLAKWFDCYFAPLEKHRSYARPSRRQSSSPDIPRPKYVPADVPADSRTFGVVIDTSGSMSAKEIGMALGSIASYAVAKEVPFARVVFCDAAAYDAGYLAPEDIAGRVEVKGRGGTVLQPGIDLLEHADDFPKDGPILIITDGYIEDELNVRHDHAFLIPEGRRLPFRAKGEVFYYKSPGN